MPKPLPNPDKPAHARPILVILSGPSGVGKDAVLARMKETKFPAHFVVTLTTRPRRPQEVDNVDYRFVSREDFEELLGAGQLLESANVYGNLYGVPRQEVERALKAGSDTVVKVDVQGVENIKKVLPQAVSIFLAPPAREELIARLAKRNTESGQDLAKRLDAAKKEFEEAAFFDYVVINHSGEIDRAVQDISSIISMEKCQPVPAPP
jgi:guanylate kinase